MEFTLSSPCFRSNLPVSRQGVALAHPDSLLPHDLVLWTDGSVPSPLGKCGSGVLVKCSLYGTETTLSFSAGPVCLSFSPETCFSLLLLSDSRSVLTTLSSPPSFFYLNLSGRSDRNCLLSSPVLLSYNGSADIFFSGGTTQLISWPDGEHYSCPLQSLVSLSPLISRIHFFLFSDWRRTVSSKFFVTEFSSISTEELVLPRYARCDEGAQVKLLFLQDWQNRESFLQRLRTLVPGHLSFHSALSSYGLIAPLAFWRLYVSLRSLV